MADTAIVPTRAQNYPEWYQQVITAADMAENSPVRGCMVIKPWGYAVWENMQAVLDRMFKDTGHVNAYFPLLIPLSFLEKEAAHVEGFAKECAVVTHHRLKGDGTGKLVPDGELEEPLIIRPTSETIIGHQFAKWVKSYRDLPILVNQWCNVMRWEMRTRMFLRTAEFLWQEGHTVHATAKEAQEETLQMLDVYAEFAEKYMAMPVIKGMKTPDERFPGAVDTYTIEALMQDRKALQAGTSHFLGQNFAKASEIKYLSAEGKEEFAWTTSWGVSTRLIGGLIMTHSDDNGFVAPPKIAPLHVVIIPIYRNDEEKAQVLEYVQTLSKELKQQNFSGSSVRVKIDDRDMRGGEKAWQYIKQGVPVRVEVGPRDMAKGEVFVGRRDRGPKEKASQTKADFVANIGNLLQEIQDGLFERAKKFRDDNIKRITSLNDFEKYFSGDEASAPGFAMVPWCEEGMGHELLAKLKVTPRCAPLQQEGVTGNCIFSGKPATKWVLFAKSY
ncbi:proline--tRNA ligase [Bdellovibrio bacteriovorus]|uniref:Proline--tRNA ligase n=1 Tax=Bdellovibrio bacteriovorus TaxID=959 RepID=A0A162GHZ5_BDEBC|nr:proline--tRNA ligase [Bdellovibrio bacteriovorus]KYG68195.1 proline--tRNA ligase [Bdellovibrio bacteriovorus]